jgi:phage FluMu protein gp41
VATAAPGSHVTVRGIPQSTAVQNLAIVAQPQTIATPSRFGVVLMQLIATVGEILGGVSVVEHREP